MGSIPRPQFVPTTAAPASCILRPQVKASSPRTVMARTGKTIWLMTGSSGTSLLATSMAKSISSRLEKVSMIRTSAPPSARPRTCSRKLSRISSSVMSSSSKGKVIPEGPTDPATYTWWPAALAAISAPARLIANTWSSAPDSRSLNLPAPKVLVSINWLPERIYSSWALKITSGACRFNRSRFRPRSTPRSKRYEPNAPSPRTTCSWIYSRKSGFIVFWASQTVKKYS